MSTLVAPRSAKLHTVTSASLDPLPDERALVERSRVDLNAFALIYRHYLPRIHSYAWRRTSSHQIAEDICSATFESALRNLQRFEWRSGGIGPWLFRIASNEVIAHYRREGRPSGSRGQVAMARLHNPVAIDDHDRILDTGDEQLRTALNQLSGRYQTAIALRFVAELDPSDAAAAMGLAKPAYTVVLSRALKALRKKMAALEHNGDSHE